MFLGFVIPGETAAVLGGRPGQPGAGLASAADRPGRRRRDWPLVGYEIGRHLGSMPDAVMTDAAMQEAGGPASGD